MKELQLVKYWIFDLDNTLYSGKTKVFQQVDKKMSKYISDKLDISIEEAKKIEARSIVNNDKSLKLTELAGLITKASYIIANDTGPAHMAAHLGAKGLTLFGSHTTAYKVSIERENFKAIQVNELTKLTPEKVFDKIKLN